MNLFTFVKSRISILDVAREYAHLKKAGYYWKGQCPFHNEKTPSFTVSPHKEIYYCFGCHSGGDVIAFIAAIEQCSHRDAAFHLIERYGITPPPEISLEKNTPNPHRKKYFETYFHIAHWCHQQLTIYHEAHNYVKNRNINRESIDRFLLGYFPPHKSLKQLLSYCLEHNILMQDLIHAGILVQQHNNIYSPFEDRIIFPIKDSNGKFCGFGGRIFKEGDQRAKYYNSPDHEYFSKGTLLFGFDTAKKEIQKNGTAFVVEGYTDCIALVQAGFIGTIATLGTACTQEHLKLLSRHTQHLIFMYDGDRAGQDAMVRLTQLCWSFNIEISIITLPQQYDPASYLAEHKNINAIMNMQQDIFHFFIEKLGTTFKTKHLQDQMSIIQHLIQLINRLDDPLRRTLLFQKAATALGVPIETLYQQIQRLGKHEIVSDNNIPNSGSMSEKKPLIEIKGIEKKIFCAMLNEITLISEEDQDFIMKNMPDPLDILLQKWKIFSQNQKTDAFNRFFDSLVDHEKSLVSYLLIDNDHRIDKDNLQDLVIQFYKKRWKTAVNNVKLKLSQTHHITNEQDIAVLLEEFISLKQKMLHKGLI